MNNYNTNVKVLIDLNISVNCISTLLVTKLNYKSTKLTILLLRIINVNSKTLTFIITKSYYLHTMLELRKLENIYKYRIIEINMYNIILDML